MHQGIRRSGFEPPAQRPFRGVPEESAADIADLAAVARPQKGVRPVLEDRIVPGDRERIDDGIPRADVPQDCVGGDLAVVELAVQSLLLADQLELRRRKAILRHPVPDHLQRVPGKRLILRLEVHAELGILLHPRDRVDFPRVVVVFRGLLQVVLEIHRHMAHRSARGIDRCGDLILRNQHPVGRRGFHHACLCPGGNGQEHENGEGQVAQHAGRMKGRWGQVNARRQESGARDHLLFPPVA